MAEDQQAYRYHVFCCTNQRPPEHERGCCQAQGGIGLRNHMKARVKELELEGVRINAAGCLNRCEDGPAVVVYPEGIWYRAESKEDIEEIIAQHLLGGQPVARLRI
ncbi:MAG: (2Fe-2S) ferredoxin domain-containing protein [Alphaproteobacteria bacterium]|jgi:(2Fe-2S) ferredoxin|nr:(2Fe-2S) ferredoxin domain-containing protein [Alphaproteobacteria bacterium]MDP6622175.1 (2Fe-2S) ferredoxin domain-containing protein [Alphaproteobacteria bacterium]|tara:strand:+ start:2467 stop:2784 length:318 start_codon:yes stop_codon:yes gene_type:complete